jgi:hypothetical protein
MDPNAPNPSAPPANPPAVGDTPKFAGKYADDAAALKGVSEIRKQVGLEELAADKPLYGENGHFRDRAHAESQYKEYERIYHATRKPPANTPAPNLSIKNDPAPEADDPPDVVMQKAGITREEAAKALESGSLTAEQIAKIRAAVPTYKNLSDAKINLIAKGHYAEIKQAESRIAAAYSEVSAAIGGEEKHVALRDWAKVNMDAAVREKWSKIVESDPTMYSSMMNDVAARHAAAIGSGKTQPLINPSGAGTGGIGIPSNRAEFQALSEKASNGNVDAARVLSRMSLDQINAFA